MDCLNDHQALGADVSVSSASALAGLMAQVSAELCALAEAAERMHDLLGDGRGARAYDAEFIRRSQSIDHTHQHLQTLSAFLARLSEEIDPSQRVDLARPLAAVHLSDLKRRLSPGAGPAPVLQDAGEMEFL